ncbi:hypothetical protein EXIGLDRAFT_838785 [Exidia glandulosa HHB12029]|uniref:F-box domain-containing protein n=1 Tax=Exidia glandulosa HHB12029 TaxID=1314781 RepID=A0A165FIK3_EXIGL|nr:hypothetical protein EXIGLDRAFT_838785 [Exidia glandulosa HHB12029]
MPPATRRQTRQSTGAVVAAPAPEPTQSDPELSGDDGGKFFEESEDEADEPQRGKGRKQAPRPRAKPKVAMPPATRRQTRQSTGAVVAAPAPEPTQSDADLSGDDGGGFFEDSEDEVEEPQRGKGRKRARTSTNGGTPRRAQAKTRGKKFKLLELSPELLDQVLAFTHPKALIRLAWTCKKLSDKLMSRESAAIWIAARTGCDAIVPECPADVSELRWAHLLFGPTHCFTCWTPNVHTIIFPLRRRSCVACKKQNMMWEKKFGYKFPQYDDEILGLLPYSNIGPWAHGHESTGKFYWVPDITALLATLGGYTTAIRNGEAGAQQALREWKADRRVLAAEICEEVDALIAWAEHKGEPPPDEVRERDTLRARKYIVEAKLLEDGWEKGDISSLNYWPSSAPAKAELTAGGWTTIKKKLEPKLQEIRQRRLEPMRRELARAVYHAHVETLPATEWAAVPYADEVLDMKPFADVIKADASITVTDAHFAGAREQLPELLNRWLREKKQSLVQGLILPSFTDIPTAVNLAGPDDLYLAVAVFVCAKPMSVCGSVFLGSKPMSLCGSTQKADRVAKIQPRDKAVPFIGLDEVLRHIKRHHDYPRFSSYLSPVERMSNDSVMFSERGCVAAVGILRALQRDPRTTRPTDLDKLKAWFQCAHCVRMHSNDLGFVVMDWRRCISHYIECADAEHAAPSWTVYTPTEATQVWFNIVESHNATWVKKSTEWACARCGEHSLKRVDFDAVVHHAKETHNVQLPQEGDDIIWVGNTTRPMSAPVIIAPGRALPPVPKAKARQAAPAQTVRFLVVPGLPPRPVEVWRCVVCRNAQDRRQNRKFNDSSAVKAHVKAVHNIDPQHQVEGTHFCMAS